MRTGWHGLGTRRIGVLSRLRVVRLATWNVNSLKVRLPHLLEWLAANPVDVVCLQETKQQDADWLYLAVESLSDLR